MSSFDLIQIFRWWSIFFVVGLLWLPFSGKLFPNFLDKGYIFSKLIGISAISYLIFILGFFHLVKFTSISSLLIGSLISLFIFTINRKSLKTIKSWRLILTEEILFLVSLIFWCFIKAHQPDIHGLEKYMDFGFINSILRSTYFPPTDMWYPPLPINYYYFGHFITAVLTKISQIPSYITFDLMLSTIFAFCVSESFSVGLHFSYKNGKGFSFKKSVIIASLTGLLISFAGNIQTIYAFFKPYTGENPPPFWNLPFSPFTFPNLYWYPNATRFIYHTIHEFPIYSFVVSDLHGHVLDIPVVLMIIALLLALITNGVKRIALKESLVIGFLLAIAYMTNAWDGLIYFLLTASVMIYKNRQTKSTNNPFIPLILVLLSFVVVVIPFSHFFKPFVSGIGVICAPQFLVDKGKIGPFLFEADHCQRSPLWQLAILWGFFYFWAISFLVMVRKLKKDPTDAFIIICIAISTMLIIVPEFLYAKDIYPAHYRANTMFKLVYQSFMMLSLPTIYIISRVVPVIRSWGLSLSGKRAIIYLSYLICGLILFSLVTIYPFFAISAYFANLKNYVGLNGIQYLQNLYPDDYKAINWINNNIKGQPVMLEAQGDSYSDYERMSANTGLPTVLGWSVHEWLWRGSYAVDVPRIADIETVYDSSDVEKTKAVIKKYNIQYIYIGNLEREKYKTLQEEKLKSLGNVVFSSGETSIISISRI